MALFSKARYMYRETSSRALKPVVIRTFHSFSNKGNDQFRQAWLRRGAVRSVVMNNSASHRMQHTPRCCKFSQKLFGSPPCMTTTRPHLVGTIIVFNIVEILLRTNNIPQACEGLHWCIANLHRRNNFRVAICAYAQEMWLENRKSSYVYQKFVVVKQECRTSM